MAQIDILKEVLDYSLRKFKHYVIGSNIYFSFNNERYAIAKLKKIESRAEYNGISIIYVSKLFGIIDQCDIYFKDVFSDCKMASINISPENDEYRWYEKNEPSNKDLIKLAEHVERYINLIGDFGEVTTDYAGVIGLALQAGSQGLLNQAASMQEKKEFLDYDIDIPAEKENGSEDAIDENIFEKPMVIKNMPIDEVKTEDIAYVDDMEETISTHEEMGTSPKLEESIEEVTEVLNADVPEDVLETKNFPEPEIQEDNEETSDEEIKPTEKDDDSLQTIGNPISKEKGTKGGIFGLFKGREKKTAVKESTAHSSRLPVKNQNDEDLIKPFVQWNIGKEPATANVKASLCSIENGEYRLTIYGNGEMQNFKSVPWHKYADRISVVEIQDGVRNIGNGAFKSFAQLVSICLPDSIEKIGLSAFEFCFKLNDIQWSQNLKVISDFAFAGTDSLKVVDLPDSVEIIRDYAFDFSDGFEISHKFPKKLQLGAGINYTNFKNTNDPVSRLSVDDYVD